MLEKTEGTAKNGQYIDIDNISDRSVDFSGYSGFLHLTKLTTTI